MKSKDINWWPLYLLIPAMLALLIALHLAHFMQGEEEIGDGLIVGLTFALMFGWVSANGGRLERYYAERDRIAGRLKVTEYEPPSSRSKNRELWQGPVRASAPDVKERIRAAGEPMTEEEDREAWWLN